MPLRQDGVVLEQLPEGDPRLSGNTPQRIPWPDGVGGRGNQHRQGLPRYQRLVWSQAIVAAQPGLGDPKPLGKLRQAVPLLYHINHRIPPGFVLSTTIL